MVEIRTRTVPERRIAAIHGSVRKAELPAFILGSHRRLLDGLEAAGARPDGAPFVIYRGKVSDDAEAPVEAAVPFTGPLESTEGVEVRVDPAHDEAFTVMTKGSVEGPELQEAYDSVFGWLQERGDRPLMKLGAREIYFEGTAWEDLAKDAEAFEVAIPFQGS